MITLREKILYKNKDQVLTLSQSSGVCYKMGEQPGTLEARVATGRILPRTHLAVDPGQEHEDKSRNRE